MASNLEFQASIFASIMNRQYSISLPTFLSLTFVLLLSACSGSRNLYKKGGQLEEAGMYREATEYYINALARKKTNVDAKIALKRSGQKVLDEYLTSFYQAHAIDQHQRAVESYLKAEQFRDRVKLVGVGLEFPPNYEEFFFESRLDHVTDLYAQAKKLMGSEDYDKAKVYLEQIKDLMPGYEDVQELSLTAFQEPMYRSALMHYEKNEYREAYRLFSRINEKGSYKESKELEGICLENGRFTIGILPFKNQSRVNGTAEALAAAISKELIGSDNPFIQVLDRSRTADIQEEQFINMSDEIGNMKPKMTAQFLGAEALLIGEVVKADMKKNGLERTMNKGFRSEAIRVKDAKTGKMKTSYTYHRTTYYGVKKENRAVIGFQYRLISTATSEILAADLITLERSDQAEYIEYNGNIDQLYPGTWGKYKISDKVDRNYGVRRNLKKLSKAKKSVRTAEELATDIYGDIAKKVANELEKQLQ